MDTFIALLTNFGLPTTLLLALAAHHVRTVGKKDTEIQRLNDARVAEKEKETETLLGLVSEFTSLQNEQQATLMLIAGRLERRR